MYNINWGRFVRLMVAHFLRKLRHIGWLEVLVSQVKRQHAIFIPWSQEIIFKLRYTSQIIYLEKRLNDKWDPVIRGIYIENVADVNRTYLYNKVELKTRVRLHSKWDPTILYVIGQWVVYKDRVYRATDASFNLPPDLNISEWANERERDWVFNQQEYQLSNDFIVWVPVAVIFDNNEMKALINYYKLAGKRYTINTY